MKKILFYSVVAVLLVVLSISVIIASFHWKRLVSYSPVWYSVWVTHLYILPFTIAGVVLCVINIIKLLKSPQMSYPIRYTYEQYEQNKKEKQKQKNQAKIDKLQSKINQIEKD